MKSFLRGGIPNRTPQASDTSSYGTACRVATVGLSAHVKGLERATAAYEASFARGSGPAGEKLLAASKKLLAALRAKE